MPKKGNGAGKNGKAAADNSRPSPFKELSVLNEKIKKESDRVDNIVSPLTAPDILEIVIGPDHQLVILSKVFLI